MRLFLLPWADFNAKPETSLNKKSVERDSDLERLYHSYRHEKIGMNKTPLSKIIAQKLAFPMHRSLVSSRRVRRLSELISSLLPDRKLLGLDIGCGSGEVAKLIEDLHCGTSIKGSDLIVRPGAVIEVIQSSADKLPFENESFDFVLLIDVLHHTEDPQVFLAEAARVSRSYVIIKDHYCQSFLDRICLSFMDWIGNRAHDVPIPMNYLSKEQWKALYAACDLSLDKELDKLNLYNQPLSLLFDRELHFISRLDKKNKQI